MVYHNIIYKFQFSNFNATYYGKHPRILRSNVLSALVLIGVDMQRIDQSTYSFHHPRA